MLIEIARLDDAEAQAALWQRLKHGGTVREARRAKPRAAAGAPHDAHAAIMRDGERLLHRLEGVTTEGLRRDPDLLERLPRCSAASTASSPPVDPHGSDVRTARPPPERDRRTPPVPLIVIRSALSQS